MARFNTVIGNLNKVMTDLHKGMADLNNVMGRFNLVGPDLNKVVNLNLMETLPNLIKPTQSSQAHLIKSDPVESDTTQI